MWRKRKQLIIATAVVGLLAAGAPALDVLAQSVSPFGKGNPLDNLQAQVDSLNRQLQDSLNRPMPTNLKGDYAVLGNLDCMVDTPAFGPNLQLIVGPSGGAATQHQTLIGTEHYNGDGTGTETLSGMIVTDVPFNGAFPIGTFNITSCRFTYAVNPADGTFSATRLAGCVAKLGDGSTTTLNSDVKLTGRITNGGKMLLIAGITPAVEKFENSVTGSHERVCTRSVVATKIK
jgi:hypothetical protein